MSNYHFANRRHSLAKGGGKYQVELKGSFSILEILKRSTRGDVPNVAREVYFGNSGVPIRFMEFDDIENNRRYIRMAVEDYNRRQKDTKQEPDKGKDKDDPKKDADEPEKGE